MNPEKVLIEILFAVLGALGPALVRRHIDEWEAARAASDAAFAYKFGEKP